MTSEMAVEDIEQLQADGLKPTVKDIIRLNALALKFERAKSKYASSAMYLLPRVAFIDSKVYFRQPTIGHELWLNKAAQVVDQNDYQTAFAVRAYALSRDCDALCDPFDKETLRGEVERFLTSISHSTEDQVLAALSYVQNGLQPDSCEYPTPASKGEDDDAEDWGQCIALGALHEAMAILHGVTAAEAKKMTYEELDAVIHRAYAAQGLGGDSKGDYELGCYYRTLDDIRARLEKEKNNEVKNG